MATTVGILASIAFIGWLVYRAVRGKTFRASLITYWVACVAGVYTYAYFLSMDMPQLIKILISILLGIILIFLAAYLQRRRQMRKT